MRCQRCGFEIEPGQTFCSMCGTEQSKALRTKKEKWKIKSIFGIIKVASTNHLKMYGNLALIICLFIYMRFTNNESPAFIPYMCLGSLLFFYILFQCLVPYKNPNSSKSKKYKLAIRVSFILIIILGLLAIFDGGSSLLDLAKKI